MSYEIAMSGQGTRSRGLVSKESTDLLSKYVSSLTDEQRNELVKTLADLTTERNLKRLEEALDQRNQATEEHDLKLLIKHNALLNELYEEEEIKYEAELLTLEKLKQKIIEKEVEFELRTREQEMFGRASKKPGGSALKEQLDNVLNKLEDERRIGAIELAAVGAQ
ncbi:hypothetical protein RFI_40270 [Reticulomyxa filosa]|uniref:Uncharacterized protein n=1 Tax=Reticulomyxa filosa TaxID=46433 RepID=X6L897_RETFI|nr:hypothetical protein RFI_40270 [Reticulomyxa filosa]|eukprot:ETN97261.1 hypothetical protein RFI_40270 [Reticulomyxa filosa]